VKRSASLQRHTSLKRDSGLKRTTGLSRGSSGGRRRVALRDQNTPLSPSSQRVAELLREAKIRDAGVSKCVLEMRAGTRFVADKIAALIRAGYVIGRDVEDGESVFVLVHDPDVGRRADTSHRRSAQCGVSASSSTEPERLFRLPSRPHFELDEAA
jgi:hypothetical protein